MASRTKYYLKPEYKVGGFSYLTSYEERSKTPYSDLPTPVKQERMGEEYIERAEELFSEEQFQIFKTYYYMNFVPNENVSESIEYVQ